MLLMMLLVVCCCCIGVADAARCGVNVVVVFDVANDVAVECWMMLHRLLLLMLVMMLLLMLLYRC